MLALCAAKESGLKIFDTRDRDDDEEKRNEFGGVVRIRGEKNVRIRRKTETTNSYLRYLARFPVMVGKCSGGRREERGVCVWDTNRPGHECQVVGLRLNRS